MSASTITIAEFKDALSRYPSVLQNKAKPSKDGAASIESLDRFRYIEAPARYSKKTGQTLTALDLQKLVEWKLRHGHFRPSLPKQVASNTNEKIAAAASDGFGHYTKNPTDIKGVLEKLAAPLRGVGPATASLLLAVYDPDNVLFFSDEAFKWLVAGGESVSPKYNIKEFEEIFTKANALSKKLGVSPIDIEKVAFVLIRENEPVYEPKPKKEPSGLPRGRPKMAESEKKVKKAPSGLPRGRPKLAESKKVAKPSGGVRGRPAGVKAEKVEGPAKGKRAEVNGDAVPKTPKAAGSRGRPKKVVSAKVENAEEVDENAEEAVEIDEEETTPKSAKRKATEDITPKSSKKSKA